MIGKISGIVKVAASVSLAGGILAAAAGPAAAASPNESDGLQASGVVNISPVAQATYPGVSPVTLAHVSLGVLTADVMRDKADATSASSDIVHVVVRLGPVAHVVADVIRSSCSFDPNTSAVTGTSSILRGRVELLGLPINLGANVPADTIVNVPGIATITLNQQTTASDGTLTVNAVYIQLLHSAQTITLGTSVCNAADLSPVPVLPGKALPIGLGGLTVLMLGGLGYQFSRRRRAATAAA